MELCMKYSERFGAKRIKRQSVDAVWNHITKENSYVPFHQHCQLNNIQMLTLTIVRLLCFDKCINVSQFMRLICDSVL